MLKSDDENLLTCSHENVWPSVVSARVDTVPCFPAALGAVYVSEDSPWPSAPPPLDTGISSQESSRQSVSTSTCRNHSFHPVARVPGSWKPFAKAAQLTRSCMCALFSGISAGTELQIVCVVPTVQ